MQRLRDSFMNRRGYRLGYIPMDGHSDVLVYRQSDIFVNWFNAILNREFNCFLENIFSKAECFDGRSFEKVFLSSLSIC